MEKLGCDKWLCHVGNINFKELLSKINELWIIRKEVRKTLRSRMRFIKQHSALNADLVKDFVMEWADS